MRTIRIGAALSLFVAALVSAAGTARADEFTSSSYRVLNPVLAPSGFASSASYQLFSSISELATGTSTASSYTAQSGFLFFPFASTPAVSATAGNAQIALSWTVSSGFLGWTPSSYSVGQSTASGGPYSYTALANVTSSTRTGLTNGTTYYFVIVANDAFGNAIATSTQVSAAPVAPASTPAASSSGSSGGGGGGGGGGATGSSGPVSTTATVILRGRAYPGSTVTILRDSVLVSRSIVQESAAFFVTVSNLNSGTYFFSIYGTDPEGNQSSTISIPITVTASVTTDVTGIFLAPTIVVDKIEVKKGNPVRVFGRSAPESSITISVGSENELFFQTPSDKDGIYSYSFLTTPLEMGNHSAHSIAAKSGEVSRTSKSIAFLVGTKDVPRVETPGKCGPRGDLNCDGKINLIDFSVEAFWYKKKGFPAAYDLNADKMISIIDFSIMASNWTG